MIDLILRVVAKVGGHEIDKCREILQKAAFAQRSLVAALLDSQLVNELEFLEALAPNGLRSV